MHIIKKENNKFYIGESAEAPIAEITFKPQGKNEYVIDHTYVSEALKGQGIGSLMVNKVVELARQENKKIVPVCPFAKKVMTQGKEYGDVLSNPE